MKNEQTTIKQILAGEEVRYGDLVEYYQTRLVRYCLTITKDVDAAEDVAQEAFIKAFEQLERYNPRYKFSTWLYRIAHNVALNSLRKRPALPLDEDHPASSPDESEGLSTEDREVLVGRAIATLPLHYQTVIHLHYWEGRPYTAIAEIMDVPITTIKSWLHRARQELKEKCHEIVG